MFIKDKASSLAKSLNFNLIEKLIISFFISTLIMALLLSPVNAQISAQKNEQTPIFSPDNVIATVNGEDITEADLSFAAEDMQQDLANIPADQRKAFLISVLIDMKILAQAARKENLQQSDSYKRRLSFLEDRALRRAYFTDKIAPQITTETIKQYYDNVVSKFEPQEEIRARHILVNSEEDAKLIAKEIENGKPFEIAALENSTDQSAKNGGDLGFFTRKDMVEPFSNAAFALEIGKVSEPVQTQFGWHLIRVEEKRMSSPPSFEQIKGQIQQQLLIEAFNKEIQNLKENTKIEISDPNIAEMILPEQNNN